MFFDFVESEAGNLSGRSVEGFYRSVVIDGQNSVIHRFDDASVQKVELVKGALFLDQEMSYLPFLFRYEAR